MSFTYFMCSIEEKLAHENKLPNFYRRYVDDTFALVPDLTAATDFLSVLNDAHPAIQFTMETAVNNSLPFVGMVITKTDNHLNTSVYRKKTNKGLLLHYQSHVDNVILTEPLLQRMLRSKENFSEIKICCKT